MATSTDASVLHRLVQNVARVDPPRRASGTSTLSNLDKKSIVQSRSALHDVLFSGISACFAITCVQPFEVSKTRFQTSQLMGKGAKHSSLMDCLFTIASKEGIRTLQSGWIASCMFEFTTVGARFGVYAYTKAIAQRYNDGAPLGFVPSLGLAMFSGGVAATLSSPFYLMKTRCQAISPTPRLRDVVKGVIQENAVFNGLGAFVQRTACRAGIQLATYDTVKRVVSEHMGLDPTKMGTHACSSFITGAAVIAITQPLDFAATQTMAQASTGNKESSWQILRRTVRHGGIFAPYAGAQAAYLSFAPYCVLIFLITEQMRIMSDKGVIPF